MYPSGWNTVSTCAIRSGYGIGAGKVISCTQRAPLADFAGAIGVGLIIPLYLLEQINGFES